MSTLSPPPPRTARPLFGSYFQFPVADLKIKICMYYRNREEMTRKRSGWASLRKCCPLELSGN